jgi:hypothetical protein
MSVAYSKWCEVRRRGVGYYIDPVLWLMVKVNVGIFLVYKLLRLIWG